VKLGVDVLRESKFAALANKRTGLIVNPASVAGDLTPTVDVLRAAPNVQLVALFGPEHGVYGDVYAGDKVPDMVDPRTGIPIFSLYGKTKKPTPEMLKGIDALVFDLQDLGARSYTYVSTLRDVIAGCAENNVELIILDRPNPLGGNRIEGGPVAPGFESHVSYIPTPYLHGMTMGELAIGDTLKTASRTVTIADIEHFAAFTGDNFYAHMDEEAARASPIFEGRVAHGYLVLSFAAGLFVDPDPGPVLANTGLENLRFQTPLYPGDAMRVELTVRSKSLKSEDTGVVRWAVEIFNQKDELVATYDLLTENLP
jgi:acyl dehydratase